MRNLEKPKDQEFLRLLMNRTYEAARRLKSFAEQCPDPELRKQLHEDAVNLGATALLVKSDFLGDTI